MEEFIVEFAFKESPLDVMTSRIGDIRQALKLSSILIGTDSMKLVRVASTNDKRLSFSWYDGTTLVEYKERN